MSKYERIMQMYPQLTTGGGESSQWRAAEKDMRHPCKRDCSDQQPMTCYYYMVVHYDDTMAETCKRYLQVSGRISRIPFKEDVQSRYAPVSTSNLFFKTN